MCAKPAPKIRTIIKTRKDGTPPTLMPQWQIPLVKGAFYLSFVLVAIGLAGIWVLTGEDVGRWVIM